ncbi:hypothetical protein [Vreelandella aquamarina]|uniref:Uncharacterized protein n=1 Tax=Vreelandella aquamarina TaxID=77097 RepID=A0A857GPZ4_9GAMM|nr:hypothetical protein [Halomonas meridiana]QHD50697.1 hypothetical protein CTT34_13890 [Halomonas meridiana]
MRGDEMGPNMVGDEKPEEETLRPESIGDMFWVFQELSACAQKVVNQTFKRLSISDENKRKEYLSKLEGSIFDIRFKDRKLYQSVEFNQYEVEDVEFRKLCADQAIRYAVAVLEEFNRNVKTSLVYPEAPFFKQSAESFQLMINWLVEAQRHLAALDVLENVRKKIYTIRAAKGGHSLPQPASGEDQRKLLKTMITGLMCSDLEASSRIKRNATAVADKWAEEIYEINKKIPIFSWGGGLDKFRGEVLNVLIKKRSKSEGVSERHMRVSLRLQALLDKGRNSNSENSSCEDADLIHERGHREGVRSTLIYLLEQHFSELPDEGRKRVNSISDIHDLLACIDRLPEASSWQTVLQVPEEDK